MSEHLESCEGCSECAQPKIYSTTDLPFEKYGCFYPTCKSFGIAEVEVGWDTDSTRDNHFYTLCGDHQSHALDFYVRNMVEEKDVIENGIVHDFD